MGHARACLGKHFDFLVVEFDTMRMPNVIAGPPQILRVLTGQTPKMRKRIGDILGVFGKMGVQHDALVPRKDRGVAH